MIKGKGVSAGIGFGNIVILKNEIRKNAKEIFGFFDNRNVQIRVISGDNPITVSFVIGALYNHIELLAKCLA